MNRAILAVFLLVSCGVLFHAYLPSDASADTVKPEFESATLNLGMDAITISFDEAIDVSETDLTGLHIRDAGEANDVSLAGAGFDPMADDSDAIFITLTPGQLAEIIPMDAPQLNIDAGAFRDTAGNTIDASTGNTVKVVEYATNQVLFDNPIPAGQLPDSSSRLLGGAYGVDTFTIEGRTYAAVTASSEDGLQIIDVTDPDNPSAAGMIGDNESLLLDGVRGIDIFTAGSNTYAAAAALGDNGLQIIDITDPRNPAAAGQLQDTTDLLLSGAAGVDIFTMGDNTYAAVASRYDNGLQIIDVTDPANLTAAGKVEHNHQRLLRGALDVSIFTIGRDTYAAVASTLSDGLQIIIVTNPDRPDVVGQLEDTDDLLLDGAHSVDTFTIGDSTYAAVASQSDHGLQIIDITNAASPAAAGNLQDDGSVLLSIAYGVDIFTVGQNTYAAVTPHSGERGLQIIDVSDPDRPAAAGHLQDTEGLGELLFGGARDVSVFKISGIYYAAAPGYLERGFQMAQLTFTDDTKPSFESAALNENTGAMTVTFNSTINLSLADLSLMHVSDARRSNQVPLAGAAFDSTASDSDTVSITLTQSQLNRILPMNTPQLDIRAGAVSDLAGNEIDEERDNAIALTPDITKPSFASASLDENTGAMIVAFSEIVDISATNLGMLYVSDADRTNEVSLDGALFDSTASDSDTISITLIQSQLNRILPMATPQLDIAQGAASDLARNRIDAAANNAIALTPDATSPTFKSAVLYEALDTMIIIFSEAVDASAADPSLLYVSDDGRANQVPLTGAGIAPLRTNPSAVSIALTQAQLNQIDQMTSPQLDIAAGAVSDLAGNAAPGTDDAPLAVLERIPNRIFEHPVAAGQLKDTSALQLRSASTVDTFEIGGGTYAVASSSSQEGFQIVNITDPYNPTASGQLKDDSIADGLSDANIFEIGGSIYATAPTYYEDFQLINVTDPTNPEFAGMLPWSSSLLVGGATGTDVFEIGADTYVALAASDDNGLQLINVTDPSKPTSAGQVRDTDDLLLEGAFDVRIFVIGAKTYAAVTALHEHGFQIINVTDPYHPAPAGQVRDAEALLDEGHVDIFEAGAETYAAVSSTYGLQLINVADPDNPEPAGQLRDTDDLLLGLADSIAIFDAEEEFYALVSSATEHGIQVIRVTDPYNPAPAGQLKDDGTLLLAGIDSVDIFESGSSTYAAVASSTNHGIQIVKLASVDGARPAFASGSLNENTGRMTIAFNETIDISATDLAMLYVSDANRINQVSLEGAGFDRTAYDSDAISLNLTRDQLSRIIPMAAPQLDIARGVASDLAGNAIDAAPDNSLEVVEYIPKQLFENPAASGQLKDTPDLSLSSANDVKILHLDGRLYAAATSGNGGGLQLINIDDPDNPIPAGRLPYSQSAPLESTRGLDIFMIGTDAYAAVTSFTEGFYIVRITDPDNPSLAGHLPWGSVLIDGASDADIFQIGMDTYAALAASYDDGLQLVRLTDPANPAPAGQLADNSGMSLDGAAAVAVFDLDADTYAAVASDEGLQLVRITDPANPVPAGHLADTESLLLGTAEDVDIFEIGADTYAAVASFADSGLQLVRLTDPANPAPAGQLADTEGRNELLLNGASGVRAFKIEEHAYAAVASGEGLQLVRITDPYNPVRAGQLKDDRSLLLGGAEGVDIFELGNSTYAIVASSGNNGLQIARLAAADDAKPSLASAALDQNTGRMTVAFDETIDVSSADLSLMRVSDRGQVSLAGAAIDSAAPYSDAISLNLTMDQINTIRLMRTPQLDMSAGAVSDILGNEIAESSGNPIRIIRDTTKPVLVSAALDENTNMIKLTFSEPITFDIFLGNLLIKDAAQEDGDSVSLTGALFDLQRGSDTISISINGPMQSPILEIGQPTLDIRPGAVRDLYENRIDASSDHRLDFIPLDRTGPSLVSAAFDERTITMTITFDETIDASATDLSRIYIKSAGEGDRTSLGAAVFDRTADDSASLSLVLEGSLLRSYAQKSSPVLDIAGSAVWDVYGNSAGPRNNFAINVAEDSRKPSFEYATLDENTGELEVFFDETIDISAANLTRLHISDTGQTNQVVLTAANFDPHAADSDTLSMVLRFSQLQRIHPMAVPQLDIEAGAVSDFIGNAIDAAPDRPIEVTSQNVPPTAPPATAETAEDTPVIIIPEISDSDGGMARIFAVDDPDNGAATRTSTAITYTPDQDYVGSDTFGYTATDGRDYAQGTITVTVTEDNNAPVLGLIGDHTADVGSQLIIIPTAADADPTDAHTYAIERGTLPDAAAFSASDGRIAWTPVLSDAGSAHTVTITVNDGRGGADSETFDITVNVPDTTPPVITVSGDDPLAHELGDPYNDPGATSTDNDPAYADSVTADASAVDAGTVGDYDVTYTAADAAGNTASATRTVQVRDTTPPAIAVTGDNPLQHELGDPYSDPGATSTDNDPAYTDSVTADTSAVDAGTVGDYDVTYTAADAAGNTASATRTVQVRDTTPPVIEVSGDDPLMHELGDPYSDPGATSTDNDPAYTDSVTADASAVDAGAVGDYDVTYTAADAAGNTATVTRTVQVRDTTPPAFESADLDENTGELTLAFDEAIDASATNLSALRIYDAGQADHVSLAGAAFDASGDSDSVSFTIRLSQMAEIIPMADPQLDIGAGAVSDLAGNAIGPSADNPVAVSEFVQELLLDNPAAAAHLQDNDSLLLNNPYDVSVFAIGGSTYAAVTSSIDNGLQIVNITNPASPDDVGRLRDDSRLDDARGVDTFAIGQNTYAAVASYRNDSLQIIDIANPGAPAIVGSLADNGRLLLDGARDVAVFKIGSNTYAAVTSFLDDGLQIVDVTNPARPAAAGNLGDTPFNTELLNGANSVEIFAIGRNTYAAVTSSIDDGLQIVDVTNPARPAAAGRLSDGGSVLLDNAAGADIFAIGASTYAAAASQSDHGLQIIDITNPARISAAGHLEDDNDLLLEGAYGVKIFAAAGRTYAAVTANADDGLQIVDVTDPANPAAAGRLKDSAGAGDLLLDGARGLDIFAIDRDVFAAVASAGTDDGVQIAKLAAFRASPPFVSAMLYEETGELAITFGETLDISETDPAKLHISDTGGINPVSLEGAAFDSAEADSNAVSLTLTQTQLEAVLMMASPQLDIGAGAVSGLERNTIAESSGNTIEIIPDPTGPAFESATLYAGARALTVTFDETLDVSETNLALLYVSDADQTDQVSLAGAAFDDTAPDSSTIYIKPISSQQSQITSMATPQLDMGAGAVSDIDGNPAEASADNTITVTNAPPPNNPPAAPAVQETTAEDVPVTIIPAITDADGDAPRISGVDDPESGTATFDNTAIVYTPAQDFSGTDSFSYTATDGKDEGQGTITVTVTLDNNDPVLGEIGSRTVLVDTEMRITPTVTDGDPTDAHEYSIARGTLPVEAVFTESDGMLVWTPAQEDAGSTHTVTITVHDGRGGSDSETFDIVVTVPDTVPPVITVTGDNPMQHELGHSYTDEGATADDGSNVVIDASGVNINAIGDYTVTYTATDPSSNTGMASRTVHVRDTTPPTIAITGDILLVHNLGDSYEDPGATATDNDPAYDGAVTSDASQVVDSVAGNYTVTYTATDPSSNTAMLDRTVQVRDIAPPAFESATLDENTGRMTIVFDETIDASATDPALLYVSDAGRVNQVSLSGADFDSAAADSTGVSLTLSRIQLRQIIEMEAPQLDIGAGAVYDLAGNAISASADNLIAGAEFVPAQFLLGNPHPAGELTYFQSELLFGSYDVDVFEAGSGTYAAVTTARNALQIINVTDPRHPSIAGNVTGTNATNGLLLDSPRHADIFTIGAGTYAAVTSSDDNGLQIINVTDPRNPVPAGQMADNSTLLLENAFDVDTFEIGSDAYAIVTSSSHNSGGIQIINVTDPDNPVRAGQLADGESAILGLAQAVRVFKSGQETYAAVGSALDGAFQIIRITDPFHPEPAGQLADTQDLLLGGIFGIAVFEAGSGTYAAAASDEGGLQLIDISDPANLEPAGQLADADERLLGAARSVAVFELGSSVYAAVTSSSEDGLQIVDVTDPDNLVPAGYLNDTEGAGQLLLEYAGGVDVFSIGQSTYAAVAARDDHGIQIARLATADNTKPAFASAVLDENTGELTITFNETMDASATDPALLHVSDADRTVEIALAGAALGAAADSAAVSVLLTEFQMDRIIPMAEPQLDIALGAASDLAGNLIAASAGNPIQAIEFIPEQILLENPVPAGQLGEHTASSTFLLHTWDADIFQRGSSIYAVATATRDDGLQLADVSDPDNPVPAGQLSDTADLLLDGAAKTDIFEIKGRTYAATTSVSGDHGLQITDITDPDNPDPAGQLRSDAGLLRLVYGVDTFKIGAATYAAAASGAFTNPGLQLADVSNPDNPVPAGQLIFDYAVKAVHAFEAGNGVYVAVSSERGDGLQLVDVSDPAMPISAGHLRDTDSVLLYGVEGIDTFRIGQNIYAAAASTDDNGLQLVDVTDPASPEAAGKLADSSTLSLDTAYDVRIFEIGAGIYAAVSSSEGLQIVDVTDPVRPAPAGHLADTEDLLLSDSYAVDVFATSSGTYAAVASHDDDGLQLVKLAASDRTKPAFESAALDENTGEMTVAFDKAMDISLTDLGRMHISDSGQEDEVSLAGAAFDPAAGDSDTISLTLTRAQLNLVLPMDAPELDIGAGAASDISRNPIDAAPDRQITLTADTTKPSLASASLNHATGILTISFDETIDVSETDPALLYVTDKNQQFEVRLTGAGFNGTAPDSDAVSIVLTQMQMSAMLKILGPRLNIMDGAVSDLAGNAISAADGNKITVIEDTASPSFVSAALDENTGIMTVTFDEAIDASATRLALLYVSDAGQEDEVSLAGAAFNPAAGDSDTISLTLNRTQLDMIIPMAAPELDIAAGAVHDLSENPIAAAPDNQIALTEDATKPSFASATLEQETGVMTVSFDETLDISETDPALLYASNAGQANSVSLAGAGFNSTAPDSGTISLTLAQEQLSLVLAMAEPQLDIAAGAVSDLAGNAIEAAADNPIAVKYPNIPPDAPPASAATAEDTPVTITPAISDSDGGAPRISAVDDPDNGSVAFTDTTVTYTPDQDFDGTDVFGYNATDGEDYARGTITVAVARDNNDPVLGAIASRTAPAGMEMRIAPMVADDDPTDVHSYHLARGTLPAEAAFTESDGVLVWTPAQENAGSVYTVTITVRDGRGGSDSATFSIIAGEHAAASPDTVLWNAAIEPASNSDGTLLGWDSMTGTGGITYHTPSQDAFAFNGQNYAVTGLYAYLESSRYQVNINPPIPNADREHMHAVMGDLRCSLADARASGSGHSWPYDSLADAFYNAELPAAILHNQNYLTLNGPATVTVPQGGAYADAGASTPDGAAIAVNDGAVDTSTTGVYKIQYEASKGCGVLDTAVRTVVVEEPDTEKPAFAYASLDLDSNEMTAAFSETVDISETDLSKLHVSDADRTNEVALAGAAFDAAAPDSDAVSLTLTQAQLDMIAPMSAPQLDIEAGAVKDLAGNAISDAPDGHILIFAAGADTVLWNATLSSTDDGAGATGWDALGLGSIEYHTHSENEFVLNGAAYSISGLYHSSSSPASTRIDTSAHIPPSERGLLHIAIDDKRCSFSAADADRDEMTLYHSWPESILANPFSDGESTAAAILYNSNYLTLDGSAIVSILQGSAYEDAGASTPDGAAVASNASAITSALPAGAYKIQYNATKGCGLLDAAVRTVVVEASETTPPEFASAALDESTRVMTIAFSETIDVSATILARMHVNDAGQANAFSLETADFDDAVSDSSMISMTLSQEQLDAVLAMSAPQLGIDAGAVADLSGNAIEEASGNPIAVSRAPNIPPTASDAEAETDEDTPVTITPEISDPDRNLARISAVDDPENGAASSNDTAITYTPDPGYFGTEVFGYAVTDGEDTAQGTVTVTVRDATAPVIMLNGNQTFAVELGGAYAEPGAAVTDNDPAYSGEATPSGTVDANSLGTYNITYTAPADAAGNEPDAVNRTVVVRDTTAPVISITGDNPLLHELGSPYEDPGATADDGAVAADSSAVNVNIAGNYTVTYAATDGEGNKGTAARIVHVRDTMAPVIALNGPPSITVELGDEYAEQGASVSDNDPAYATANATVGGDAVNANAAGVYTVTYTAPADDAGNLPDPVSRNVTVQDTTAPVIALNGPPSITVELGDEYAEQGASVSDNDPAYAGEAALSGAVNASKAGTYTITYSAPADGASNEPVPVSRTVTVQDTTKPVITVIGPTDITLQLGDAYLEQGANVTDNDPAYAAANATVGGDAVNANATGVYTVTYTAPADDAGNLPDPVSRTVTVQDTNAPVITLNGSSPMQHELGDPYVDPGATADDGSPVVVNSSAVNVNVVGDYTVTYTATDSDNNTGSATRTVQVRDTTPPVITLSGDDPLIHSQGDQYADPGASAADNDPAYDGTVDADFSAVDISTIGDYAVTYAATDPSGNTAVSNRIVHVRDTAPPEFASARLAESTSVMTITFSETLDVSETDLSLLYASDAGQANNVTLQGADFDSAGPNSTAISMTLNQTQLDAVLAMAEPQLDIEAGAVTDLAGNTIDAAPDNPITVTSAPNSPPAAPDTQADTAEDTPVTITPAISDSDQGDTPEISAIGTPANGAASFNRTAITYTPAQDFSGTDSFDYTVTDGQDDAHGTINITVTQDNNDPVLGAIGNQTAQPGAQLTIIPAVTDADPTDTHSYNITGSTLPANAIFAPSNGTLVWTPAQDDIGDNHTVTITVHDGRGGSDSETFVISVADEDLTPPVITVTGDNPLVHERGEPYDDPGATADDGSTVFADLSQLDAGVAGDYLVIYTATDLNNNTGTANRTVQVRDTTPPDFASATLDQSTGVMIITFSETIDVSETDLSLIYASESGEANESALTGARFDSGAADSNSISLMLSHAQLDAIIALAVPQLDIAAGAVADVAGLGINDTDDNPITIIEDAAKPRIVSASLDRGTRIMTVTFDGPVDVSAVDLSTLRVSGEGSSSSVRLSGNNFDHTAPDGDTISIMLTELQLNAILLMTDPRLVLGAGAVADLAGNEIDDAQSDPISLTGSLPVDPVPAGDAPPAPQPRPSRGGGGGGGGGGGAAPSASDESVGLYSAMWDCNAPSATIIMDSDSNAEIRLIANSESFTPVPNAVQNLDGRTAYTADAHASIMLLRVTADGGSSVTKTINTLDACTGQIEYVAYVPDAPAQIAPPPEPEPQEPEESSFVPVPVPVQEPDADQEPDAVQEQDAAAEPEPAQEPDAVQEQDAAQVPECEPGQVLSDGECAPSEPASDAEDSGCLIATAAYGTELAPQVQMLRELRDNTLLSTESGSAFMDVFNLIYYSFSPTVADWERQSPIFKEAVRIAAIPLIYALSALNYADINGEWEMTLYGAGIILAVLAIYAGIPAAAIYAVKRLV